MIQSPVIKQGKQKIESKLFDAIYKLPQEKQVIDNFQQLQSKIQAISFELNYQAKTNVQQIQRVCKTNSKLHAVARLLREHNPPANLKQYNFCVLISSLINMFTLMMTSNKMVQFFNKLSIPFSIYRIILRIRSNSIANKQQFLKRMEIQFSFKFIWKMLNVKSKTFPRLYAFLVLNILSQYSENSVQIDKKQQQQGLVVNKQNQRMTDTLKTIISIGIDLIKNNLKLAAQTGILVAMYKMATQNNLSLPTTTLVIENIAHHMKTQENRDIILGHLDLCKVFSIFTNVDLRLQQGKKLDRLQKCCMIIEMLLSYSSTLFYFIHEKLTLQNFVISLKSKNKGEKQKAIINQKIFKKLIDKALRYDLNKMQRSFNYFGRQSNYLNYSALLILSFFLTSTDLFDIYLNSDPNGELFAGLGKVSLMYFPITFQKAKYNKEIIQTIKIPSVSDYERLDKAFLNIISYYDDCIIPFQFSKNEVISYLLYIKELEQYKQIEAQKKQPIEKLLKDAKQTSKDIDELLTTFYRQVMKICEILPWKPQYLKLSKFLSLCIDYLHNHKLSDIKQDCLEVVKRIFTQAKPNYYRYLYITALDDAGKYFQDNQIIQQLILTHYKNHEYSFRITRILLHVDLNEKQQSSGQQSVSTSYKDILKNICSGGCDELVLLVIQIIKIYCVDYDDKVKWGAEIIEKCVYSQSQQVACAAVQFWQEFDSKHRHSQNYLQTIKLGEIKDQNLRKRIMFLMLNNQRGIQILSNFNPNFIKQQIDLWLKQGNNNIKQFSSFLTGEYNKFTLNKDPPFLDIGKCRQNRRKLIYLPWNIIINNQKRYIALATHKFQQQRIKLRVTAQLLIVQTKTQITFSDIGGLCYSPNTITFKREEIIKYHQRNKNKDIKDHKKLKIIKQNVTFYFKYQSGVLVLRKLVIDIALARDVYRSLTYPLSFITLLTKTGKGLASLRQYKFAQNCINYFKFLKEKQEKGLKDSDIQVTKGAIQCLGLLFSCRKLTSQQKIQIFQIVMQVLEKTNNFQLKQVALWVLNIIVKDDDLRIKMKSQRGWLIMESKYCSWLCFPLFYNQSQFSDRPLNQYTHVYEQMQRALTKQNRVDSRQGCPCPLTNLYLQLKKMSSQRPKNPQVQTQTPSQIQTQINSPVENTQMRKRRAVEYFRKQQNKQYVRNGRLLEKVIEYLSIVNFRIQKVEEMLDLFTGYFLGERFENQMPSGLCLP